jgi:hypothetical protein
LMGSTYKIKTPLSDHALYVTINDVLMNPGTELEHRIPFEVFINSKNMEHFQWVTALTRVISAVFRKGGDVAFLTEELKQVFDPQGGYFKKGGRVFPCQVGGNGVAKEYHQKSKGVLKGEEVSDHHMALIAEKRTAALDDAANAENTAFPPGAQLCKKCNVQATMLMDGCMTCLNCGDSKCS